MSRFSVVESLLSGGNLLLSASDWSHLAGPALRLSHKLLSNLQCSLSWVCITETNCPFLSTVASHPNSPQRCSAQPESGHPQHVAALTGCNAGLTRDRTTAIPMLNVPLLLSHFICFCWEREPETGPCSISLASVPFPL